MELLYSIIKGILGYLLVFPIMILLEKLLDWSDRSLNRDD